MNYEDIHLCFIGNMLGRNPGFITTQGQILADLFEAGGYKVTCVSSKINKIFRLLEIIWILITKSRSIDFVLIDTYSGLSFITADVSTRLCRMLNLPSIIVLRGGNLPEFIKKHPRRSKRVLDNANFLAAPSRFLAEEIEKSGYKVKVIPNVININKYPYRERSRISPNLIWMRSFHPVYNPEMAVNVFARVRRFFPDAKLVMAGADKGLETKIKKIVQESGLTDAVRFAGFLDLDKKIEEFSQADIYLNTNRIDNMPVSVVEACAFGLPVIATDVGGVPYLIENHKTGILVPNEGVEEMVEGIKQLLENPALTNKLSKNGRVLAEKSAWESVYSEWKNVFDELSVSNKISSLEEIEDKC